MKIRGEFRSRRATALADFGTWAFRFRASFARSVVGASDFSRLATSTCHRRSVPDRRLACSLDVHRRKLHRKALFDSFVYKIISRKIWPHFKSLPFK